MPQLLKVREACGGYWAAGKSQDRLEKSREEYCQRQKWAKHEDGGFGWKIQGATKLSLWETSQVGESDGQRVTHTPSHATHMSAHEGQLSEKDTRVGAWLSEFLPPVDRFDVDESTSRDILPVRDVVGKVR